MKILTQSEIELLNYVIKNEIEFINLGYKLSATTGHYFVSNAITSFVDIYLQRIYGNIVPQFSSEYRFFILGLLSNIDRAFKDDLLIEILIPTVGKISDKELYEALKIA